MLKKLFALSFTCLIFLVGSVWAGTPSGNAVKQLQDLLADIHTIKADFNQQVASSTGETMQQFTGRLVIKRPGKLYWESYEPMAQKVITDGKTLWYYDADLEQLTEKPVGHEMGYTPAMILSGDSGTIGEYFNVSIKKQANDHLEFTLVPKDKEQLFEKLNIIFDKRKLIEINMLDSLGQKTSIQLSKMKINEPVKDDLFAFIPPKGTEVTKEE